MTEIKFPPSGSSVIFFQRLMEAMPYIRKRSRVLDAENFYVSTVSKVYYVVIGDETASVYSLKKQSAPKKIYTWLLQRKNGVAHKFYELEDLVI